jgi:hypothetical protein
MEYVNSIILLSLVALIAGLAYGLGHARGKNHVMRKYLKRAALAR